VHQHVLETASGWELPLEEARLSLYGQSANRCKELVAVEDERYSE
jgi:hypothetical protein